MNVLVACEESQIVCMAFRNHGCNAYSCDILPCSGGHPEWHIQNDVSPILNGNCTFNTMDGKQQKIIDRWDMIIAFPPCTFISNAGACRLYPQKGIIDPERYQKGLKAKEFFLKIWNADCDKIAIENPVHSKVFDMPEYTQQIQPYQFDKFDLHPYTKKTRLWLKNVECLIPSTPNKKPTGTFLPAGTSRKIKSKYGVPGLPHKGFDRSKTFTGIADAMAEQWSKFN